MKSGCSTRNLVKLIWINLRNFSKKLVKGLPKISFDNDSTCEFYQRGKQTKSSLYSKNVVSATGPLELLHFDLFGPTRTISLSGKKYGLVIVDDFSRFTWVIFLVHKDELVRPSKSFQNELKMKKSFCISSIRSDYGGEWCYAHDDVWWWCHCGWCIDLFTVTWLFMYETHWLCNDYYVLRAHIFEKIVSVMIKKFTRIFFVKYFNEWVMFLQRAKVTSNNYRNTT